MKRRVKKIPRRTCIGCGTISNKKELLRIVRTPEQEVLLDPTGKKSGRGAYICPAVDCLEKAFKGDLLAKKLEATITPPDKERLREQLATVIPGE
jgi:predicted RNA-binding protein YlxR (DUF448 family)